MLGEHICMLQKQGQRMGRKWACEIVFLQLIEDNRALNIFSLAPAPKRVNARALTHEQLAQIWFYCLSQTEKKRREH